VGEEGEGGDGRVLTASVLILRRRLHWVVFGMELKIALQCSGNKP
jgi:hypothetical protein